MHRRINGSAQIAGKKQCHLKTEKENE